eukprot:scaffold27246_cov114-Isochrysis_galbana.AAC.3
MSTGCQAATPPTPPPPPQDGCREPLLSTLEPDASFHAHPVELFLDSGVQRAPRVRLVNERGARDSSG